MKRYLAFAYDQYYPCGGKGDFVGDFDTLEAATALPAAQEWLDVLDTAMGEWVEFGSEETDGKLTWRLMRTIPSSASTS